jgi:hypothetical protein
MCITNCEIPGNTSRASFLAKNTANSLVSGSKDSNRLIVRLPGYLSDFSYVCFLDNAKTLSGLLKKLFLQITDPANG